MADKANMIFVSGVPDQVRVGDKVFMQVCLMEAEDFVSGAELTAEVEDKTVAHIMEKPDTSSISIPGDAMDDPRLRESYVDMYDFVPTYISTQKTGKDGQAVFLINFQSIGVTKFFVRWQDRGEVRTEEIKVVVFQSGFNKIQSEKPLIGAGEFHPEEGRITDQLKGIPMLRADGDDYIELITLDEEIQEIPAGMDDDEYVESKEILHADIDAPDELFFGGEGVIRVKLRNVWGGVAGREVELESLTPNVSVFSHTRQSMSPSVISDKTGKDGFVEFRISHVGDEAEKARMVIRWDTEGKKPKSKEVIIHIHARLLHLNVDSPAKAEVNSRVQIKLHVHELGKPIQGIPITISSDSGDVAFFLITRDSRADVKSDYAKTDNEGNVLFQVRYQGKESRAVKYSIKWNRDGIEETVHSSTIEFFKPEETIQEDAMAQNTGNKKKTSDPMRDKKKIQVWVGSAVALLFIICFFGAWIAWDQGVFKAKKSTYAFAPDVPDKREIHAGMGDVVKDIELSAPTEDEDEADMAFSTPGSAESEAEPPEEELPPPDEEPATEDEEHTVAVPPDAFTYDVRTETVLVYSDSLGQDLKQGKVNKIKLNQAQKEVEDLQKKLKQSKGASMTLATSNDSLEARIQELEQEINSLQSGEPNLDLIKVDKIECSGQYKEIKNKKGEIIGVKIPLCKVYLSTIDSK